VVDSLPLFVNASNFSVQPESIEERVITWCIPIILERQEFAINYTATLSDTLPFAMISIRNFVMVISPTDTTTSNDLPEIEVTGIDPRFFSNVTDVGLAITVSQDTVLVGQGVIFEITVTNLGPDVARQVSVADTIDGLLIVSNFNRDPDLIKDNIYHWVIANMAVGEQIIINYYAVMAEEDLFEESMTLMSRAGVTTENDKNPSNNTDSAIVTFIRLTENCDLYYFDLNVFQPETGTRQGIHFSLTSDRNAKLDLYDITGYHIGTIVDDGFAIGNNVYYWDGTMPDGKQIGSGVYVIALRTGKLICWKKVIIIR